MDAFTLGHYMRKGRLLLLLGAGRLFSPFYRLNFLAAAGNSGLLKLLHKKSASLEEIACGLEIPRQMAQPLEAWLKMGVSVKELGFEGGRYRLSGFLAKSLARPENDPMLALIIEIAGLHGKLILDTPERLRNGNLWTLCDQDGSLIARSSRILEPFVKEALRPFVPMGKEARLLEVGCGSGVYMFFAAELNRSLTGLGLELQPEVAERARKNLAEWGVSGRMAVEEGDVRDRPASPEFDMVSLHNNIYYFPAGERTELLRHLKGFLKPGGVFLATTACPGGSPGLEALNLWAASTLGCGPLPAPSEMVSQLKQAGFIDVKARRLIPGESYFAFYATAP